jgi:MOSC domain-containing protein YiiM
LERDTPHIDFRHAPRVTGRVETIHIAPGEGVAMEPRDEVEAVAGRGLVGDRYAEGIGHYSPSGGGGRHLTLIEAEVLADLAATGMSLAPGESRRNVMTNGIGLNDLVGRRFRVGEVEAVGIRLCEPCTYLEGLVGLAVMRPLVHRAGLRADILVGGRIRVGDIVEPIEGAP